MESWRHFVYFPHSRRSVLCRCEDIYSNSLSTKLTDFCYSTVFLLGKVFEQISPQRYNALRGDVIVGKHTIKCALSLYATRFDIYHNYFFYSKKGCILLTLVFPTLAEWYTYVIWH